MRTILTYKDYEALPADGRRYELHEGELSVTPAPGSKHQEVSVHLVVLLYQHVKTRGLGKVLAAPIDCVPEGAYQLTGRLEGSEAASLLPFPDLGLVPASIWP